MKLIVHGRRFAVGRQRHLLRADNPSFVLDVERHLGARVAGLRQHDVDDERRALQRRARRLDARHLHVAGEPLLADADGEDRNLPRLQAGNRFVDRGVRRVGAVGHHHEPGQRQARQLVARAIERAAEPRRAAFVLQLARRLDAIGGRGEAEEAKHELLRERVEERPVGAERVGDEGAARAAVAIGDLQAARIVQQDAEEILLRDGGLENQRRPQQAERDHGERRRDEAPRARRGRGPAPSARRGS